MVDLKLDNLLLNDAADLFHKLPAIGETIVFNSDRYMVTDIRHVIGLFKAGAIHSKMVIYAEPIIEVMDFTGES